MTNAITPKSSSDLKNAAPIYAAMFAPVIALVVLSGFWISSLVAQETRATALSDTIALSTIASNLAHELQKERGMSAGHVGSKGAQFGAALPKQRKATDAVLAEVAGATTATRPAADERGGQRLQERADRLTAAYAELRAIRQKIDSLQITVPELAAFYTAAIRDLLSIADDPLIGDEIDSLARMNAIYQSILMAKEFAGVERAAGSVGFGKGAFDDKTFAWFNGLQQRQSYLFDRISALGGPAEVAAIDKALSSAAAKRVEELRAVAAASLNTKDVKGVTGPAWFAASTQYLGELRKVERQIAAEIQGVASAQSAEARMKEYAVGGAMVLFLALFVGFGFRYINAMVKGLHGLRDAVVRIERADDGIEIPAVTRRDSIGEIARALGSISTQGADAARVRAAVSASETPFLILDNAGFSVFENQAFTTLSAAHGAELGALAPVKPDGRRAASMLLEKLKDAEARGCKSKKSRGEDAIELHSGALVLEARLSPVDNASGARIGTAVQLANVTEVRVLEKEVVAALQGVERGEFSHKVTHIDNLGFTSLAARGLNKQMDSISTFMDALEHSLSAMAAGDLTQRMEGRFEGDFEKARESVNANLQTLVEMVGAVSAAAQSVQSHSAPLADRARNLSQRAEEQAAALEEVNATMEEMSGSITRSAESAKSATALSDSASERAAAGHKVLDETRSAMSRIESSSHKVVEIVTVIDSIAFQTNLLALNAAVEAARAGDAGKGFAVVASEVRTLAQRSSEAANEIRELISASTANVQDGVALMERTKTALDQINESIVELGSVIGGMSANSADQAASAREISETTSHLDGLTQQNASAAEESANGADDMLRQANELIRQVARFRVTCENRSDAAA